MITLFETEYLGFLLLSLVLSWILPSKLQPAGMILCGIGFISFAAPVSLVILSVSSLLIFFLLKKNQFSNSLYIALIAALIAVFSFFKFRVTISSGELLIPLGLSYYSFRQIHYIFEKRKGTIQSDSLYTFLCYMFFVPTLLVGPINRYPEFVRDIRRRRLDGKQFALGLERILTGYFKIVVLAGVFCSRLEDWSLTVDLPFISTYLHYLFKWFDLYLTFSGYADVAIGFGALSGFAIMENFNFPFLAPNIREFWNRWHISLTSWIKDYVYYPFASATRLHALAVLITLVVMGLWHEFSLRYVLWGIYHGLGIIAWHIYSKKIAVHFAIKNRMINQLGKAGGILLTVTFVSYSYPVTKYVETLILRLAG